MHSGRDRRKWPVILLRLGISDSHFADRPTEGSLAVSRERCHDFPERVRYMASVDHNSFPTFHGLIIPSLFIRNLSVERFIPNRSAAPLGPAITHFVFFNVSRIRSRSVSAIVLNSDFVELAAIRFGRS